MNPLLSLVNSLTQKLKNYDTTPSNPRLAATHEVSPAISGQHRLPGRQLCLHEAVAGAIRGADGYFMVDLHRHLPACHSPCGPLHRLACVKYSDDPLSR